MPFLERWLAAQKMVEVFDKETIKQILDLGGQIGGGWNRIHQHVWVTPHNKEAIEELLTKKGFEVAPVSDVRHPENTCNH
jgi:hypothetical protein